MHPTKLSPVEYVLRTFSNGRWRAMHRIRYAVRTLHGLFDFRLPNRLPARGYVHDAGFDELSIHVAINPKGNLVCAWNAGLHAGDAFAAGWLERRKGAWLQSATDLFNCKKNILQTLADMTIQPRGYGDRGRVIM